MKGFNWLYRPIMLVGIFCLCLVWGGKAFAGDANQCAGDIAKFCKEVKPNMVMDCLEKHESELSDACRTYEAKMGGKKIEMREEVRRLKIFREACNGDIIKFCGDVKPEQGGIEKCLGAHEGELSAACSERLRTMQGEGVGKTP